MLWKDLAWKSSLQKYMQNTAV